MAPAIVVRAVLVLGFHWKEFQRFERKVAELNLCFKLIYGGHIGDGSNAVSRATQVSDAVNVVVWRPERMRYLPSGFFSRHSVLRVNGVSGAINQLVELNNE